MTSPDPRLAPLDPVSAIARAVDGTFVVVVKLTGGKTRRTLFLSLAGAEREKARAVRNGHDVQIVLAELKPLYRVVAPDRRGEDGDWPGLIEVPDGRAQA